MRAHDELMKLATRECGVAATECQRPQSANKAAWRMVNAGCLFRAILSTRRVRYFTRESDRDAYMVRFKQMKQELAREAALAKARERVKDLSNGFAADWDPDTPAIMPPDVVVQVGPCYQPRYQAITYPGQLGCQRGRT